MSDVEFTAWVLYNMLPTPMPVDQIGLARRVPTMLSRATALDAYDLRSALPANFAFGGRVRFPSSNLSLLGICRVWQGVFRVALRLRASFRPRTEE